MAWPPGNVKARDQPLIEALPVLVTVRFSVRPVFQALTAALTRHAPDPGGGLVVGPDDGLVGPEDGLLGGPEVGVPLANWVKKAQTTSLVQVCQPSQVQPSRGPGSWPAPSN